MEPRDIRYVILRTLKWLRPLSEPVLTLILFEPRVTVKGNRHNVPLKFPSRVSVTKSKENDE